MASPDRQLKTLGPLDLELQSIRPTPPSRQPTLEAQHHVPRRAFLRDLSTASKLQPKMHRFYLDYNHLRNRSRAPVASLFYLIVKRRKQPPDTMDIIESDSGGEICLSDWLNNIHEALSVESSDSIMLW